MKVAMVMSTPMPPGDGHYTRFMEGECFIQHRRYHGIPGSLLAHLPIPCPSPRAVRQLTSEEDRAAGHCTPAYTASTADQDDSPRDYDGTHPHAGGLPVC